MFSPEVIHDIQLTAAAEASRERREPLVPWEGADIRMAPFLGEYVPAGWRPLKWDEVVVERPRGSDWWHGDEATLFIDATGIGRDDEPCLTYRQAYGWVARLLASTSETVGVGIREAGQFQVYLGLYVKDDDAPGTPVDESHGLCADCGAADGPFDYHDCEAA